MIGYSDLTQEQKYSICNGCGGKGGIINPPEFLFHASCNQHDFYYWRGGTELDRKKADDAFYEMMKVDAGKEQGIKKLHYLTWAYVYYKAVRLVGSKFFNYGVMKDLKDL